MSSERTLDGLLKEIDGLVKLSPANFSFASKRGEGICKAIKEFKDAIEPGTIHRDSLDKLFSTVARAAGQLTQSALNLREDRRLRADWTRFAQRDLIRLKDWALALQEFLVANASSLKLNSRTNAGSKIDLEEMLKVLHKDNAISERTFFMLTTYLAQNGRSKLNDPTIIEQISRISTQLSELHEMRQVISDA
ncbi:MAG: hypothetical protein AVW06_03545 [Hadesarchaea archaeon DG-33-1]|nr:MAG: hypothetical protein AVW06_03545 [Hadesarchaea archaeon DG-33-1]